MLSQLPSLSPSQAGTRMNFDHDGAIDDYSHESLSDVEHTAKIAVRSELEVVDVYYFKKRRRTRDMPRSSGVSTCNATWRTTNFGFEPRVVL